MKEKQEFLEDALMVAAERMKRGRLSRRGFNAGLAALMGSAVMGAARRAHADTGRVVVVNWGGDAVPGFQKAYAGFGEASGLELLVDGSGPSEGAVKTQVNSGAVRWDVCDGEMYSAYRLGRDELLEALDYDVIDKSLIDFGDVHDHGVANYTYSYVIAFDTEAFGDRRPTSWKDFWDVETFPGKRTLYRWMSANLECALLADGVAPEELYPLDVDRALAKIEELLPHILTHWATGAESQQLLRDGEVAMGQVWNTRAALIKEDTGGRVDWTFDGGIISPSVWMVPKGNPGGAKAAMDFIAYALRPEVQVKLMEAYAMGPVSAAANDLLSPELALANPTSPENFGKQVLLNNKWHADHYGETLERYLALIGA
ncbi:ABC transporter substrate-binding protein [Nitratireductor sp. StC3]|uniref:ABC transporter substrate-binding protein n=1 Tax=Nitratireductor sp. StC3 TaxID=2126741 RepID=UPI000D0CA606|nr:ABC transporter substrate-binding protein [Nitratireductor sp. StC3]PSM20096.1 polyamine ABC transporter substrate-binding protein [Nitratireductor sp. StC3]